MKETRRRQPIFWMVRLLGAISHDEKVRLYAGALAVFFGPLKVGDVPPLF